MQAAAAIAPVTDWRMLREFADVREDPVVAATALGNWAADLAGRPLYVVIGNGDRRVGTPSCARFVARVIEIEAVRGMERPGVQCHITGDSPGHGVSPAARAKAAQFLLNQAQSPPSD